MKKNILIIIFLSLIIIAKSNDISNPLYKKGAYHLGITCFPHIDAYALNLGNWGFTISPSFSYFIFNNFSISGTIYFQKLWTFQSNNFKTNINFLNTSISARYYIIKSHFFIEASYNLGLSKFTGYTNYKEFINNPGIGFGITSNINDLIKSLNGKLSWEYSIVYRIPTNYASAESYSQISRFAIIYHF
jgi:hypothetical protein